MCTSVVALPCVIQYLSDVQLLHSHDFKLSLRSTTIQLLCIIPAYLLNTRLTILSHPELTHPYFTHTLPFTHPYPTYPTHTTHTHTLRTPYPTHTPTIHIPFCAPLFYTPPLHLPTLYAGSLHTSTHDLQTPHT